MKSLAAISGFVAPCAARRAICPSCGVRSLVVSADRRRARSPVAASSSARPSIRIVER
jgi:hypothetical protein